MMTNDLPSRRGVLRSVLALGCGVWAPVLLPGCDAKDSATSNRPTATPPAPPTPSPAPSPGGNAGASVYTAKMTQATVQYQFQPKGEQRCATCMHFVPASNTCKLVEGQISPEGWCILWVKAA